MIGFRSIAVAVLVIFSIQDGYGRRFLQINHLRADVQCTPPVGSEPVLLPNPDDCTTFYECNDMIPVLMHCPPNLLYCSELKSCRYITDIHICSFSDCKLPDSSDSTTAVTHEVTTTEPTTIPSTSEPITTPSTIRTTTTASTIRTTTTASTIRTTTTSTTSRPITTTTPTTTTGQSNALCPPPAGNPTNLVPDPDDCRAFYECVGDTPIREYCPDPLWFCSEEHLCTYHDDANCRFNDCKKEHIQTTVVADPPTCPPPSGQGNVTLYPNAENCSTYYECDNGVLQTLDCPKGLLFCSEKSACSWSWDTECAHSDCKAEELHEHGARDSVTMTATNAPVTVTATQKDDPDTTTIISDPATEGTTPADPTPTPNPAATCEPPSGKIEIHVDIEVNE